MIRRLLDIVAAGMGLVLLAVPFAIAAIAISSDSPGPVFYRQERVGLNGRTFRILKFRTMKAASQGPSLTIGEDARITGSGRFLRKYKIDELPQLWNVLVGDMSLVGPRPEVPEYAFLYPDQTRVWSVRPGITDPTSIRLRNENEVLAKQPDPEEYYRKVLLPQKTEAYLRYLDGRTLLGDLAIVANTLWMVIADPSARGQERLDA